ncbi:hypothetical protein [Kitasatospora sp. NPDC088783]|uniref:hypothetical protein n=1 Tax=Kitasatospora sp. NPDC088783 TaxID=3364077 RepID=UPI0037FFD5E0
MNKALDQALKRYSVVFPSGEELNPSQLGELRADVLALFIIMGEFVGAQSHARTYRATLGSIVGLTALAHIHDTWWVTSEQGETHPGFLTRYEVASQVIKSVSRDMEVGPVGDHPLGFMAQLTGWVSLVLDTWLSRNEVKGHKPINIMRLAYWLFERSEQLEEDLAARGLVPKVAPK